MSEQEDLELEALQRQLDDAFETTRPRRGFEDQLWLRLQAKRPWPARLRDSFAAFLGGIRDAPAVPAGVVAVLLVAVIGIGVLNNPLHSNISPSSAPALGGKNFQGDTGALGRLPTPALHPFAYDRTGSPAVVQAPGPPSPTVDGVYYGQANLTWTGTFPSDSVQAPVYRYVEPSPDQLRTLFTGAQPPYDTFSVNGTQPQLPQEPSWSISVTGGGVPSGSDPGQIANTFLAARNLLPTWPDEVTVETGSGHSIVQYLRGFELPNGGVAYLIDWNGIRYGITVDISPGRLVAVGPLPIGLDESPYRLISNQQAAQQAVAASPAVSAGLQPVPSVKLDRVELVYALAVSAGQGFYEPCYLFSGTFDYGGRKLTKLVLVPLVDPSLRSS